jgi:hypothetical protein
MRLTVIGAQQCPQPLGQQACICTLAVHLWHSVPTDIGLALVAHILTHLATTVTTCQTKEAAKLRHARLLALDRLAPGQERLPGSVEPKLDVRRLPEVMAH